MLVKIKIKIFILYVMTIFIENMYTQITFSSIFLISVMTQKKKEEKDICFLVKYIHLI